MYTPLSKSYAQIKLMAYKTINDRMEQKPPYRVQDLNAVFKSIPIYSLSARTGIVDMGEAGRSEHGRHTIQARYIGE